MYQPFVLALLRNPRRIGAVAPSGQSLARAMAITANPAGKRVLEIGPGTGVITEALLTCGASREHLTLLERDRNLATYLARKFPGVKVIEGDARAATGLIEREIAGTIDIVISSLPLLNMTSTDKSSFLEQVFSLLCATGVMVQYTYSAKAPLSPALTDRLGVKGERAATILRNLPPASVWKYSRSVNCEYGH